MRRISVILALATVLLTTGGVVAIQGGHQPVTICHKPGTPAERTITVNAAAVPVHLRHGDYIGECVDVQPTPTPTGTEPPAVEHTPMPRSNLTPPPTDTEN